MKNFNFFEKLWEHSRTLRRVGLVLVMCLIAIPQAWAWTAIYFHGDFTGEWDGANYQINYELEESNSGHYFYPFYNGSTGDKYWRLYAQKSYVNYQLSPSTNNYLQNVGTVGYKVTNYKDWKNYNFKTTNASKGVLAVHINQGDGNGDLTPGTWLEKPTIYIWHNWGGNTSNWGDNGGSGQKAMTNNNDGTYSYDGVYSASGTNVGIQGTGPIKKYFADNNTDICTKVGSPSSGDSCRFTWNAEGYKGYDDENHNTGSLTIYKLVKITYKANSPTSGTAPSTQYVPYSSNATLSTNTGSLTKTGYVFNGWNTENDGSGYHYDVGDVVEGMTAGMTLYAEWSDATWGIKGGEGDKDDVSDALGDWGVFNQLKKEGSTAIYSAKIRLDAHRTYCFKVFNRAGSEYYGYGNGKDNGFYHYKDVMTFIGQTSFMSVYTGEQHNLQLMTAGAGEYEFVWNSTSKQIKVLFPEVNHPSLDYVYYTNPSNWTDVVAHLWGGTASTGWWNLPVMPSFEDDEHHEYYYTAIGNSTTGLFADLSNTNNQTSGQDVDDYFGKIYNGSGWSAFSVTINLDNQGADDGKEGTESKTVNLGYEKIDEAEDNIDIPVKTGYNFGGYYTETGGGGSQIINADGEWQADVKGYTDASGNWIKDGMSNTLYAKWTEKEWDVTAVASPSSGGLATPNTTTSYGQITGGAIKASKYAGYDFSKWEVASGSGTITSTTTASTTFKPTADATVKAIFSPQAASGKLLYKFVVNTGVGDGDVCATDNTDYPQTVANGKLSTLEGGSLTARGNGTESHLKYDGNAFKFQSGTNFYLKVITDSPLKTGDVIRFINRGSGSVAVRLTQNNSTNEIVLAGNNNSVVQTVVVTSAFNNQSTFYIDRKSNTSYIESIEIIRPYVLTLNANTNGGTVHGNNTENMYFAAGETQTLPHANKSSNRFKGWFTTYDGSTEVDNPYTATSSGSTIYAQFETCASIASGMIYKFEVNTGLSTATTGLTGNFDINKGNYLTTLRGGTLTGYDSNGAKMSIVNSSGLKINDKSNAYLQADLDCAVMAGDTIITTTTGTGGYFISLGSGGQSEQAITSGTNQKVVVPASLVGQRTLFIRISSNNDNSISYFEIKRPAKYTITYAKGSADGASGDSFTGTKIHGVDYTLSDDDEAFSRTGYTYDGWSTNEDGSTQDYAFGATYSTNADLTLYPYWVEDAPSCATPTSLTNGTTRYDSQAVSWTKGDSEESWEVYRSTSSDTPAADATPTATPTSASYTFTGLSASTKYYWWVRAVCGVSDKSDWVAGTSFTTSASVVITGAVNTAGYGTVSPSSITVTSGSSVSLSSNVLTCDGKTLTATASDATTAWTYAFSSWSGVTNGGTVSSNTTATANFTRTGKSYTITLDKQVASNTPTGSVSATYGSAMPEIATLPSHANYTFGGFYTNVAGGGTCYYNGTGVSQQNSDFTSTLTLYAKFTQSVTLNDNHGGDNNGSATATYAGTVSSISAPEYSGHTVDGYYAESGCSNLVMTAAGVLQTSVTDGSSVVWTDENSKWKHAAASTLYAHWKCDAPTVTCTDNVVTMTVPSGATVYYTTDGSTTPTSSSTAYDPSNKPVIAANTTIKAIAIQSGCTSSSVTTQSCTYTAFSTSINIEQFVLDNDANKNLSGQFTALKSALDAAHISYDLSSGCSIDTLNDEPSNGVYKVQRNYPYLGLKIKSTGKYVQINLPKGKALNVKFGHIAAAVKDTINGEAGKGHSSGDYVLAADPSNNRIVKLATSTGDAVVIKQIMIDEAIQPVTLPGKITTTSGGNGTIIDPVNGAKVDVGSTVTITTSPSSGYELESLTVTRDTTDNPTVTVTSNQFTMPNGNVTINATFVLSGHSVTAVTSTGDDTYGTVSAAAATVAEGGTTVITATPATGYKVTNWAVEGAGASIDPSGASNSNTTTLTMGSADATVTVTFGPKTYALTLDKNGGSANGSASITWNQRLVTFDPHATAPNASFSLDGYYTVAEGGTKIINGSGSEYIVSEYIPGWTSDADLPSWAHDADATLYAYWRRYINLNSNWDYHGTNLNYGSVSVILGGSPSGYEAATGEEGYTLQGYYTEKLGGTKVFNANGTYAADDVDGFIEDGKWIYTTEGTLSLYAHWAKQYTVTYDDNEAISGSAPSATTAFFGDDVTVAGNTGTLVKTGYTFVGWNTAADGTGSFYAVGSEFTLTGNMTLYAQWASAGAGTTTYYLGTVAINGSGELTKGMSGAAVQFFTYESSKFANSTAISISTTPSAQKPYCESNDVSNWSDASKWTTSSSSNRYISAVQFSNGTTYTLALGTKVATSIRFVGYCDHTGAARTMTIGGVEGPGKTDKTIYSYEYTKSGNFTGNVSITQGGNFYGILIITCSASPSSYTVSFADMSDFAGESTLPSEIENVYTGSKIAEPVNPTADGYAFAGWYKESACSNAWDFATDAVEDDTTLYAKWVSLTEQYTFHMGDGDISNHSWNVTTFTPTGYYENQAISNFEIPNQTRYPSFFVGYEGEFVEYAPSSGYSKIREWDDYNNMTTYQSGYIKIQGNASPISDGNTKTAAGAKGTLQMSSSTHSENWGLVFIPDGFGLTISYEEDETPKTLIVPLRQTDNEKVWETESFTTAKGNALTAAQIAGTFKVGLATATPNVYVDCYQTTEEAASAINARKLAAAYGGADMTAGASGRFQIIMSSNTSLPNFGLRWVPLENHTKQSGSWDGMGVSYTLSDKWSLEHAPTIEEDVYIEHYTGITNDAQANSVYINKSTAYMNLTISSIGSLLVMNDIKAKMADDDAYRATTENDINIETDYIYNGSLITAKKSTDTKASYRFCTKAYKAGGYGYINQFIGIPFTEMDAFQLYGSLLYQYDKDANKWVTCSQNMEAYHAYNILRRSTEGRAVFDLDGTLILPGIEAGNKEKVLECNSGRSAEASSWRGEHLFANSWTAPIEIGAMTEGDFHDVDPTIYIFNAGSVNTATDDQKEEYDLGDNPGQWTALPVNDVKEHPENYSYKVIPAMQAFSIRATAANGTLTLDYKKHVYDPIMANSGVVDHTALRAPKQTVEPSVRLRMVVTGENHYKDETQIHERADFSNGHDAGWDGYKIFGNAHSPQLYTVSDNKQLSVNAIPDMEGTIVGFEKGSDDNVYTFSFKYDGEDIWYLNDLKEQTSTLINNENTYIFSAESGDAATRFIISATPIMKVTTGVENVQGDDVQSTKVHKVLINDHIYIIRGGRMYDATGKMLK